MKQNVSKTEIGVLEKNVKTKQEIVSDPSLKT